MKIAVIVPGGVDRSGETRVIPAFLALIERLARRHDVHVFALRQDSRPGTWQLAGATIHNAGHSFHRVGAPMVRALRQLSAEHRRSPFDLVQSLFSGAPGVVACLAAARLRRPFAVHVAGGELACLPEIQYGGRLGWLGRCREALVLRRAAAVSAASAPMIEMLHGIGVAAQRVPLGVDLRRWPLREPEPRAPAAVARLIHVASLNLVKDQTTLLRALAILARQGREFHLDIVGEDTRAGEAQRLCAELRLAERVTFHGFLTQTGLRALMARAHLCVLSSRHEAGPLVMLEAATLGIPTVGSRVGHVAEWDPDAAVAVPVADPGALAQALADLLADEERRRALGRAAQTRVAAEDADHTARAFESIFQSITGQHPERRAGAAESA
jgi:glycosyltransferase involved in cell wall biosynthesis